MHERGAIYAAELDTNDSPESAPEEAPESETGESAESATADATEPVAKMPKPCDREAAWWHYSYNVTIGCGGPIASGCKFCYAARIVPPYTLGWRDEARALYEGVVTQKEGGPPVFNGKLGTLRLGNPTWSEPLHWPRVEPGLPSLIFITTTGDVLSEDRPQWVLDRVFAVISGSKHIGLVVSRRSQRAAQYFGSLHPHTVRLWQKSLWLIFSAGDQKEFDLHWANMRPLAEQGWFVGVCCAPLIDQIVLPDDACALLRWLIVSGECPGPFSKNERLRPMRTRWALSLLEQAKRAGIPFFLRAMGMNRPIPKILRVREFPDRTYYDQTT
jgi:protein gp37